MTHCSHPRALTHTHSFLKQKTDKVWCCEVAFFKPKLLSMCFTADVVFFPLVFDKLLSHLNLSHDIISEQKISDACVQQLGQRDTERITKTARCDVMILHASYQTDNYCPKRYTGNGIVSCNISYSQTNTLNSITSLACCCANQQYSQIQTPRSRRVVPATLKS